MTTAAELVSLDRYHFLNDKAVKLAVKTYAVTTRVLTVMEASEY